MTLREWISEFNPDALLADGFEAAIIGVAERCAKPILVVYDMEKCIEILVKRDGMSESDAMDFFEFNVIGAWTGEGTPLFLMRAPPDLESDDPSSDASRVLSPAG